MFLNPLVASVYFYQLQCQILQAYQNQYMELLGFKQPVAKSPL